MKSLSVLGANLNKRSSSISHLLFRNEPNNNSYEACCQGLKRPGLPIVSLGTTSPRSCRYNSGIAEEHVSTEDKNRSLAAAIEAEITPTPSTLGFIFRVPKRVRIHGEDTYDPRILSIGPFHHKRDGLRNTEKYKKWYLQSIISRTMTPKTSLVDFIKAVRELEVNARDCYAEPIHLTSDDFVSMMVHDGCFILELFHQYYVGSLNSAETNDIIFGTTWILPTIRRDLLLLENQIPFFLLECLFDLTNKPTQSYSLNQLVTTFFDPILPKFEDKGTTPILQTKHLLEFLRTHLIQTSQQKNFATYPFCEYTSSATELSMAGVKFKRKESARGLLDITFTTSGVLEIPPFNVGVSWTVLLPNLVAMEQCRHDYRAQITSYVTLLDSLIDTNVDVKLLRDKGIIDKLFKEDEKVALSVNCLYKKVIVDEFYYDELCRQVNAYSKTNWNRWRATLVREYFSSPWLTTKVVVATILLLLTFIQTIPELEVLFGYCKTCLK